MSEEKYKQYEIFDFKNNNENNKGSEVVENKDKFLFSYSQMTMYQECPLKYKFKYIDKIPEKPKPYFAFGQSIHSALEFFHSKLPPPSYNELIDFFAHNWSEKNYLEKGYLSPEKELIDFEKGKLILTKYYQKHKDEKVLPFLCEYKAYVEIDNIKVVVIADKIEYTGNGKIKIIDYKTGRPGQRTPDQLYMYQKVLEMDKILLDKVKEKLKEDVEEIKVDSMFYYYVETLSEVKFKRADEKEIERFWERAIEVVDNIKKGNFEPQPGETQCNYCDFKMFCPVFKDTFKNKNEVSNKNGFKDKILRYAEVLGKIDELKDELILLEKEIENYFEDKVLDYEDEKYKITIEKKKKYEISDRQKMIDFLKENGLYEKTLRPTIQSIISLLDEDIDENLKEKIKEMIKEKEQIVLKTFQRK